MDINLIFKFKIDSIDSRFHAKKAKPQIFIKGGCFNMKYQQN